MATGEHCLYYDRQVLGPTASKYAVHSYIEDGCLSVSRRDYAQQVTGVIVGSLQSIPYPIPRRRDYGQAVTEAICEKALIDRLWSVRDANGWRLHQSMKSKRRRTS